MTQLEATRTGRRDHVGPSADLRAVMAEVSEQVKVLDGPSLRSGQAVVRCRFRDNAELMGACECAQRGGAVQGSHGRTGLTSHTC